MFEHFRRVKKCLGTFKINKPIYIERDFKDQLLSFILYKRLFVKTVFFLFCLLSFSFSNEDGSIFSHIQKLPHSKESNNSDKQPNLFDPDNAKHIKIKRKNRDLCRDQNSSGCKTIKGIEKTLHFLNGRWIAPNYDD